MSSERLTCTDCRNVFFGSSVFCNGLGVCNICRTSNEAAKRFEKESAQRERHYNQSCRSTSSSAMSGPAFAKNDGYVFFGMFIGFVTGAWLLHAILGLDFNILAVLFGGSIGSVIGELVAR
jgi:hypothetical protein